jgi:hypothetical protein
MKHLLAKVGLLIGLNVSCLICDAMVTAISAADEEAIHAVVQSQLDAFAEDDAVSAFELATPATRVQFGNPDNFLLMVKQHYSPIYRNRLALFSGPEVIEGTTIQIVRLTDRDSRVWLAIYKMLRDDDGSWKIDGCQLLETTSISI